MNQDEARREQLSALFDGELAAGETRFALRAIEADPGLARQWSRQQLVRSTLRREAVVPGGEALCAALAKALERERPGGRPLEWLKPVAGLAIAAGVAAVALFATTPGVAPPAAPVATLTPSGVEATGLSARDITRRVDAQPVTERQLLPVMAAPAPLDPRLERYFLRHSNAAQGGARGGFVPYVYVVATPGREAVAAGSVR